MTIQPIGIQQKTFNNLLLDVESSLTFKVNYLLETDSYWVTVCRDSIEFTLHTQKNELRIFKSFKSILAAFPTLKKLGKQSINLYIL